MKKYKNRSSKRDADEKKTEIVNQFLDKYLYTPENGFQNVYRNNSKDRQVLGVDIEFDYNNQHYVCDEKASTDEKYIKKYLSTFCLELSMINQDGNLQIGWFVNDNMINNCYLMVWIDKAINNDITTVEDILQAEIVLIRKEKLKEYFQERGWSFEKLRRKAENIRNDMNDVENFGDFQENGMKFSFSRYLTEEPINVLLKREVYRELGEFNKTIKIN